MLPAQRYAVLLDRVEPYADHYADDQHGHLDGDRYVPPDPQDRVLRHGEGYHGSGYGGRDRPHRCSQREADGEDDQQRRYDEEYGVPEAGFRRVHELLVEHPGNDDAPIRQHLVADQAQGFVQAVVYVRSAGFGDLLIGESGGEELQDDAIEGDPVCPVDGSETLRYV